MTPRQTPFHQVGIAAGAKMREMFGYWLPWEYERGYIEHIATRNRASICDLDYMAEFRIKGSAALEFVQMLLTNDFSNLRVGQVRYTAMCDDDGYMVDDGTLRRLAENEYVSITGSEADFEWITSQASRFDVEVSNITSTWTTLAIQGPQSRGIVESLVGPGCEFDLAPACAEVPRRATRWTMPRAPRDAHATNEPGGLLMGPALEIAPSGTPETWAA